MTGSCRRWFLAAVAGCAVPWLVLLGAARQNAGGEISVREGVYSAAQAERGGRIYADRCSLCHHSDQFTGPAFLQSWQGQTAHALFTLIRTTMPQENPGGLKRQEYADLLAYLFELNNLPAGDRELQSTDEALKRVVIEAPARGER